MAQLCNTSVGKLLQKDLYVDIVVIFQTVSLAQALGRHDFQHVIPMQVSARAGDPCRNHHSVQQHLAALEQ